MPITFETSGIEDLGKGNREEPCRSEAKFVRGEKITRGVTRNTEKKKEVQTSQVSKNLMKEKLVMPVVTDQGKMEGGRKGRKKKTVGIVLR